MLHTLPKAWNGWDLFKWETEQTSVSSKVGTKVKQRNNSTKLQLGEPMSLTEDIYWRIGRNAESLQADRYMGDSRTVCNHQQPPSKRKSLMCHLVNHSWDVPTHFHMACFSDTLCLLGTTHGVASTFFPPSQRKIAGKSPVEGASWLLRFQSSNGHAICFQEDSVLWHSPICSPFDPDELISNLIPARSQKA